jgi:hypothetical protein
VVQAFENILDRLFDIPEIDAYPNFIQFFALNEDFYDPIVPMNPRTIAGVAFERMGRRKMGLHINFEHPAHLPSILPANRQPAIPTSGYRRKLGQKKEALSQKLRSFLISS